MNIESFDIQNIYKEQSLVLAITGAVIIACTFKLAQILKQDVAYMNITKGNISYMISFTLVSSIFFIFFKFNKFQDVKVMQEPQELIQLTPISMFGVGGFILGISYGFELMNYTFFKIQNIYDFLRIIIFCIISKYVSSLVELNNEMEAIQFILSFDYKQYNIIALIVTSLVSLFFLGKRFFLGVILGSAFLLSQVFQKYKLHSIQFVFFVLVFNIVLKIISKDEQQKKGIQIKSQNQAQDMKQNQDDIKNQDPKEEKKQNSNEEIKVQNKDQGKKTKQRKHNLIRIIIASVLGGIGYGLCGISPEYAILNVAVFSPQVTLVYIISFFVGYTLTLSVMLIIEFDLKSQIDEQKMDEYKEYLKNKNDIRNKVKKDQQ
ncbi:cyclic nucleotide-binding domain protein (macronuclear) [Tetrahymena thermophila SB210]|uniref:Cyclic nucleotide-binding domain protein n=1 Tax=Tetrahymena thermophila (strain SB210) TaxID=312017 RepID=W7WYH4_TETTS|nr:cyclic nucleotide-binding domain protein [Tetrahymena thermophila SB210]EWS71915.1 cyclic nucleotide-binding domain protein [Tetrahymena thermophila SB210]|eukprot:XP_012655544.1 cyclic nucleotide-binding domain protein [Tetrahymena thermophila SB210]